MYEDAVRQFHEKFGHYKNETPTAGIPDTVKVLRLRLLMEELGELSEAIHTNNLVEIADGLADLIYVAVGCAIAYGIPIDKVFAEVHRSNMTKTGHKPNVEGEKYAAGKTGKGEGYEPPSIAPILVQHGASI